MSKTLEQYRSDAVLWVDYRKNQWTDEIQGTVPAVFSTPTWANTDKGRGLKSVRAGRTGLTYTDAAYSLTDGTLIIVMQREEVTTGICEFVGNDSSGANMFVTTNLAGVWDYDGGAFRSSGIEVTDHNLHCVTTVFKDGVSNGTNTYVDGIKGADVTWGSGGASTTIRVGHNTDEDLSAGGTILFVAYLAKTDLTEKEISDLSVELLRGGGALEIGRRNYVFPTPVEEDSSLLLDYDMVTRTGEGLLADLSQNGNHGTLLNGPIQTKGVWNDALDFSDGSIVNAGSGSSIDDVAPLTIETVTSPRTTGGATADRIYDKSSIALYLGASGTLSLQIIFSGGVVTWRTNTGAISTNAHNYIVTAYDHSSAANSPLMWVNGESVTVNLVSAAPSGAYVTDAAADARIGDNVTGNRALDGSMSLFRMYGKILTQTEVSARYSKMAKVIRFYQPMTDVPPTFAAVTSGRIGHTDFAVDTGTWEVVEESAEDKRISGTDDNVTASTPSTQAYGTWYFKRNQSSQSAVNIVADVPFTPFTGTPNANGYSLEQISDGRVAFVRRTAGSNGLLFITGTGYMSNNTDYEIVITRRKRDGENTIYVKGGAFTAWTIMDPSGGSGTNPVTDNAVTTSKICSLVASAGTTEFTGFEFYEDVLTLAEIQSKYP